MQNIYTNGMENSPKRALLKSMGVTKDEIERPLIGIIYSHNDMVAAHSDLDKLLTNIKEGIISQGGKALLASTMSICSGISMGINGKYLLPSRELISDSIEALVFSSGFDAIVFVGSCDSSVPAMLIAAARLNLPCIFVSPGTSLAGYSNHSKIGFSSILEGVYGAKSGKISAFDLNDLENNCCPTAGSGSEMSTSNTMCCITEALGLALKNNGTYAINSAKRLMLAKNSGIEIVNALKNQLTPSRIITLSALKNAIRLIMAIGGSVDTIMHLTALAYELKFNVEKHFSYDVISNLSSGTPSLVKLAPATEYFIEDFERAGGVYAVLNELSKSNLIEDSLTVTGKNILELIEAAENKNDNIIKPLSSPIFKSGAITILYGNLAEEGCLIRNLFTDSTIKTFSGKAKVFDNEEDAIFALISSQIMEGDVMVVRYEGPKGSPGMREMRAVTSAISGMKLENKVALITDGRVGGTSKGLVIGHVCPEASEGGTIALVENGDTIDIDLVKKKISLSVPAKTLKAREKKLKPKQLNAGGYLLRYSELVSSSKKGAVMKDKF